MNASTAPQTTSAIACLCGCGRETSPKANYRPGHDAAHVSMLLAELFNTIQDGGQISQDMITSSAKSLPSLALQVKFQRAADKLADHAAGKKPAARTAAVWYDDDTTGAKVGRWVYPVQARDDAKGNRVAFRRNTKRDGSGEWVAVEDFSTLVGL